MDNADLIIQYLLEDLEPTAQWPDDFQVILADYLEQRGIPELPEFIRVKTVLVGPYLAQAMQMEYEPGDQRSRREYLANLKKHVQRGGKVPPLIVDGDKLLDGRHRLLAQVGAIQINVIDLRDLGAVAEAQDETPWKDIMPDAFKAELRVPKATAEQMEEKCHSIDPDLPRDTPIFDDEVKFENGMRMAIQVVSPLDPAEESCWTQGVLYSPEGHELGCTDVGESFLGEYAVDHENKHYVCNVVVGAVNESVLLTRQAITKAIKKTLKEFVAAGNVKCAYDVGSGECEDLAEARSKLKFYKAVPAHDVPSILKTGLIPSKERGWTYLTDNEYTGWNYGNMFLTSGRFKGPVDVTLLQIDSAQLDQNLLGPDDDDLQDILNQQRSRRRWDDHTWQESLRKCSQCTYSGVIPPSAIKEMGTEIFK